MTETNALAATHSYRTAGYRLPVLRPEATLWSDLDGSVVPVPWVSVEKEASK